MTRFDVLGRRTPQAAWRVVGQVHAPDPEMALLLAKEAFFRHGEAVDFAVADEGRRHRFPVPDMLRFATDKSYKLQSGYTGLGAKRRRAAAQVRALGLRITRRRPPDLRTTPAEDGADA